MSALIPKSLKEVDTSEEFIVETNVTIPLATAPPDAFDDPCVVKANVYRPKAEGRYPVLVTYGSSPKFFTIEFLLTNGPRFNPASYAEVNPKHKSAYSAWETPDPPFWTGNGYVVVRADERGTGQSPGFLNAISASTIHGFFDVIEWASEQVWSSGKVGLLGVSYYAMTQWFVASKRPKGLAAIVPWEGFSDYYRDVVRHGGILSNTFIKFWYDRQVASNQYGRDRKNPEWGPNSPEGVLFEAELRRNRRVPLEDVQKALYRDDGFYFADQFPLENIECPVLSVANWGGISVHLKGNVRGYVKAGSKFKYLRFITGRHDLPFYYDQEVAVQKSFLDAFLKGKDDYGWSVAGKVPPVDLCLRRGNAGVNDALAELAAFPRRMENEWPVARTEYTNFYLTEDSLVKAKPVSESSLRYQAPGGALMFYTPKFSAETEITGHPSVHISVSLNPGDASPKPQDIDLFVSLHHIDSNGNQISYTGTTGEAVPIVFGWQRVSLSKITNQSALFDKQSYKAEDVIKVVPNQVYDVHVEMWPTNVVIEKGHQLMLKVASSDTHEGGLFFHNDSGDREEARFEGWNSICVGGDRASLLRLPIIPARE
ncbi:Cocaine esterase [Lachnellula suecica]|uniref:Cocaine esterase n=1 Tax=Lachnellula suecica TaxID=602035 RepID=A0A8T9BVN4_9HELO|nr:Cocaine esterase [Lachnellula suecica]